MNRELIHLSQPAEVSMADEWFDIANIDHFWMEWRFRVIEHAMQLLNLNTTEKRYLEIGCGHGQFLRQSDMRLNLIVDGCDLNLFALQKIPVVKGQIFVYNIYELNLQMIKKYDGIFLLDVIEHIDDHETFLTAAFSHCKDDGIVVINVPALSFLYSKYDTIAGHKRRYSKKDIRDLFHKCQIEPLSIRYWGFTLLPIAILRKWYLYFVPARKVIEKGFKPAAPFVNGLFKGLMNLELLFSRNPFMGTSIVAIGRKRKQ
jgi:SAM-dependent methyltransferase